MDDGLNFEGQRFRRHSCAHMDGPQRIVTLLERHIVESARVLRQALILRLLNDADDLHERAIGAFGAEMFAKRVLVGPELFGHGFVDDGDRRSLFAVGIGEFAATQDWHLQSVEV